MIARQPIAAIEARVISVNHQEFVPSGGVNDSGCGPERGSEPIAGYLDTKFVSRAGL